jgi:hypothetical protein
VFIVEELNRSLAELPKDHRYKKWINDMKIVLKENMFSGELIRKGQIPAFYVEKYGVNNLYRYEHPEAHRSCYTVVNGCIYIFDIMTHAEHDLRFGYKTT